MLDHETTADEAQEPAESVLRQNAKLTDLDVAMMRAEAHRTGATRLRHWAKVFGVSHVTIRYAITGKSFTNLPDPYLTPSSRTPAGGTLRKVSRETLDRLYALRQSDAVAWPFYRLAEMANAAHGTRLRGANIRHQFIKLYGDAPSRPDLIAIPAAPRPRVEKLPAPPKEPKEPKEPKPKTPRPPRAPKKKDGVMTEKEISDIAQRLMKMRENRS